MPAPSAEDDPRLRATARAPLRRAMRPGRGRQGEERVRAQDCPATGPVGTVIPGALGLAAVRPGQGQTHARRQDPAQGAADQTRPAASQQQASRPGGSGGHPRPQRRPGQGACTGPRHCTALRSSASVSSGQPDRHLPQPEHAGLREHRIDGCPRPSTPWSKSWSSDNKVVRFLRPAMRRREVRLRGLMHPSTHRVLQHEHGGAASRALADPRVMETLASAHLGAVRPREACTRWCCSTSFGEASARIQATDPPASRDAPGQDRSPRPKG